MGRNIITMEQIVFATHNKNKLEEIRSIINNYEILGLSDIGCNEEIIEDADNIKGNAKIKADFVTNNFHLNCFADDTGLEVEALNGEPGVFSARYAGENCSYHDNVVKLLKTMEGIENRNARFRTVIALNLDGQQYFFEGIVNGKILTEEQYAIIDTKMLEKYRPLLGTLFSESTCYSGLSERCIVPERS